VTGAAKGIGAVTAQAFARERGLSAWTLYGWRVKLGRTRRRRRRGGGLVAVELVNGDLAAKGAGGWFEIELANGNRVRVPPDFEAARLSELVLALRSC